MASYAAFKKQQSLQLFLGVAASKLHLPEIIQKPAGRMRNDLSVRYFKTEIAYKQQLDTRNQQKIAL